MAAAFDYESLRDDKVGPLIERFGRDLTLTRAARGTTAAPIEPAKTWLSTSQGDADVDAAPAQSITGLKGVFLSLVRRDREGQTVKASTQGVILLASSSLPEEIGSDWELLDVDDAKTWEIVSSAPLKPGPTLMIYRLELAL